MDIDERNGMLSDMMSMVVRECSEEGTSLTFIAGTQRLSLTFPAASAAALLLVAYGKLQPVVAGTTCDEQDTLRRVLLDAVNDY